MKDETQLSERVNRFFTKREKNLAGASMRQKRGVLPLVTWTAITWATNSYLGLSLENWTQRTVTLFGQRREIVTVCMDIHTLRYAIYVTLLCKSAGTDFWQKKEKKAPLFLWRVYTWMLIRQTLFPLTSWARYPLGTFIKGRENGERKSGKG